MGLPQEISVALVYILKSAMFTTTRAFFVGGEGNNMKVELIGLWGLLHLAKTLILSRLMIVRDSKATIDWIKGAANLNCIYLRPWQQKIKALQEQFESVKYIHVHRIYNHIADQLSKQALNCSPGLLYLEENLDEVTVHTEKIPLF
jgi:hypothetical protein